MHPNPTFRKSSEARNIAFARRQAFGMLCVATGDGPLISHIPFLLSDDGRFAEFHLVRSNPIARALKDPLPATLAVQGPYSYVSPDWYEVDDQVPTWNYVAVHLAGQLSLQPAESLPDLLARQSQHFEAQLAPKPEWVMDKMSDKAKQSMMRQIVPCVLEVAQINGTWKLNQNKPDEVRLRAADQLEHLGIGADIGTLAHLMRNPEE